MDVNGVVLDGGCGTEVMVLCCMIEARGEDTIFRIEIPDCVSVHCPFSLF
jgi:hypothetical protein